MEFGLMTTEELKSIVAEANKILSSRAVDERKKYANAIIENMHNLLKCGGSISFYGTFYDDDNGDEMCLECDLGQETISSVSNSGDLTIKDLYFERS